MLRDVNETVRSVLLIGHNPGMHELAVMLTDTHRDSGPGETAKRVAADCQQGAL